MAIVARTSPRSSLIAPNLLGVLALIVERPSYTYEIARRAATLNISQSSVYDAIQRLRNRGLIESSHTSGTERQPRVHYRATESGVLTHRKAVAKSLLVDIDRSEVKRRLLRADGSPDGLLAILEIYEVMVLEALARLRPAARDASLSDRLAVLHERMAFDRALDFIRHARDEIEAS